jgi:uncharacterized membrane-anchored protein
MNMRMTRILLVAAGALVLIAVNVSIAGKERIKARGERLYLELAPVDPRSLMQGDYMALRFAIVDEIGTELAGKVPIVVDERGIGTRARSPGQAAVHLRYKIRHGQVWLGTNAWFFEEGSAQRYEPARYGEFRVDRDSGEGVLVGLRDKDLNPL